MTSPDKPIIDTLMLIDDSEVDLLIYDRIIKRSGLVGNTLTFLTADLALEFIESGKCPSIDAIILDVNMPRMNGFEFLEALETSPAVKQIICIIVMLTTSLDPRDKQRAEASPLVTEFLYKPLIMEHLNTIARNVEAKRNAEPD